MRIQFWHIVVLLLIVLILFGAKRLPDVASSVGKSLKIFKKEVTELREEDYSTPSPTSTTPAAPGSHSTMPADRMGHESPTGYDQPFPPGGSQPPLTPPDTTPRR